MAQPVNCFIGGIRSLLVELNKHGEAINFDLMAKGWTRRDIGRRLTWTDLYNFIRWQPPDGTSAYYRSRKPNSWWVTPELQVLAGVLYAVDAANWQRGGCQGNAPKPMKFPVDREEPIKDADELNERKRRRREMSRG